MHVWWQMIKQKGEGLINRFGINHVVVVKDEDEMVSYGGQVIEQGRQNRFEWWWLRRLEHTQHPFSNIRRNRLQSSDEVRQKACGVVISFVQRQPGHLPIATSHPCADQRSFPKAGGGSDEGQCAVQPLDQAGSDHYVRPKRRDIQFRGENWRRHEPPTSLSFSSNNFPDRFSPGPSLGSHGGIGFAFVVRGKPEDAIAWGKRACTGTARALNQPNGTRQKLLGFDWDHPGKRTFGHIGRLHLISYGVTGCSPLHLCVTGHPLARVRRYLGCARSICVRHRSRSCARDRHRISEQPLEFLLALRFGLVHFEFSCTGLTFHTRPQARRQGMLLQSING